MNYKGIVDWLQADGFVLMGFSEQGEITLMEKATGREVNDLSSFLIATVLPIAKKKVVYQCNHPVRFIEEHHSDEVEAIIYSGDSVVSMGTGETGEYAMVNAIENFIINRNKEMNDDKG